MNRLYHIFLLFIACLLSMPAHAQEDNAPTVYNMASMFMFNKDREQTTGFLDMEVDSIVFSRRMPNGDAYEYPVMQYVFTRDSLYRTPLAELDSIGFRAPETIYQDDVMVVDRSFSKYIVEVDSASYILDLSAPKYMIPQVGQIVHSELYKRITGKVLSVEQTAFGTKINLKYGIRLGRIYKQLYAINQEADYETPNGARHRINYSSMPSPAKTESYDPALWTPEDAPSVGAWNWDDVYGQDGTNLTFNPGVKIAFSEAKLGGEVTIGMHVIFNFSIKSVPTVDSFFSLDRFKKYFTLTTRAPYVLADAAVKVGFFDKPKFEISPTTIGDEDDPLSIIMLPDFNIEASAGLHTQVKFWLPEIELMGGFCVASDENGEEIGDPEPLFDGDYFKCKKLKSGNISLQIGAFLGRGTTRCYHADFGVNGTSGDDIPYRIHT